MYSGLHRNLHLWSVILNESSFGKIRYVEEGNNLDMGIVVHILSSRCSMKTIFKPGIFILDKLSFSKKFVLLFSVVILTFSYLLLDIIQQTNHQIYIVKKN